MNKNIKNKVHSQVKELGLQQARFLLAVSGGLDSMCLMHVFKSLGLYFEVAHVNYGFRPEAAAKETALVRRIASDFDVIFHIVHLKGYEDLKKNQDSNLQSFARTQRYAFFEKIGRQNNLDFIVTAHHQDDNAETILLNFLKGTGFSGLTGIQVLSNNRYRPFLAFSKELLHTFARENNVVFFEDSSNQESDYNRNFLRNEIIPKLEERFPSLKKNISNNAQRITGFAMEYKKMLVNKVKKMIKEESGRKFVFVDRLKTVSHREDIILQLLQLFDFTHHQLNTFQKILEGRNGALLENDLFRFIKENNRLIISPNDSTNTYEVISNKESLVDLKIQNKNFVFSFEWMDRLTEKKDECMYINAAFFTFPLVIKAAQAGDYFYPLGLNKKKKIAKFFIDEKMPLDIRSDQLLMFSGEKIVAVLGRRADHRFGLNTGQTDNVLCISKMAK